METKISMFKDTYNKVPSGDILLIDILKMIKSDRWKAKISLLRSLNKPDYDRRKLELQAVTFSGTFRPDRKIKNLAEYSGVVVVDMDKFPAGNVKNIKQSICQDPFVISCFISPSGQGLKALVKVSSASSQHKDAFYCIENYFKARYGIRIDKSGKDVCRLCYVSHDPEIYYNPKAEVFRVTKAANDDSFEPVRSDSRSTTGEGNISSDITFIFHKAIEIVNRKWAYQEGNRNNYLHHLACWLNRFGVKKEEAIYLIEKKFFLPEEGCEQPVKSAYTRNKEEHGKFKVYESSEKKAIYQRIPIPNN